MKRRRVLKTMYNFQSPIINNMTNIIGVGGYGCMNNGYYGNNYNTRYYNPFMYNSYMEQQRKQQQELVNQQNKLMRTIIGKVSRSIDPSLSDEQIDSIFVSRDRAYKEWQEQYAKMYEAELAQATEISARVKIKGGKSLRSINRDEFNEIKYSTNKVSYLETHGKEHKNNEAMLNFFNRSQHEFRQRFPSNMTLNDFFNNSGVLLAEQLLVDIKTANSQINKLYDRSAFNSIIDKQKQSTLFPGVFGNPSRPIVDISDQEIIAPRDMYNARRQAFLNKILQG